MDLDPGPFEKNRIRFHNTNVNAKEMPKFMYTKKIICLVFVFHKFTASSLSSFPVLNVTAYSYTYENRVLLLIFIEYDEFLLM